MAFAASVSALMCWVLFTPYGAAIWFWMTQERELQRDLQRWDGESPAYQQE